MCCYVIFCFFFFKQKTAYEMRISDWSSDVCSSDLFRPAKIILNNRSQYPLQSTECFKGLAKKGAAYSGRGPIPYSRHTPGPVASASLIQSSSHQKAPAISAEAFVPRAGLEPARVLPHWCLRPTRLPIPPPGQVFF